MDIVCCVVVSECPGGQWGLNCGNNCQCEHHECDHVVGCTSCSGHPGWTGANCDEDIDECLSQSYCSNHSDCENINGSAICHCHSWYNMVNNQCECKYWNTSISSSSSLCLFTVTKSDRIRNTEGTEQKKKCTSRHNKTQNKALNIITAQLRYCQFCSHLANKSNCLQAENSNWSNIVLIVAPSLPSARQHLSYGDCLEVKREYYQNCSVLGCVTLCSQSAAHSCEQFLQVQQIRFVTLGPLRHA